MGREGGNERADRTRVLVIDDDPIVLEAMRLRLSEADYDVVVSDRAVGTTMLIRQEQPNILLLDVMMPALDGDQLAAILQRNRSTQGVGIILHSSKSESELRALVATTGAIGAIHKTHDGREFIRRFDELVTQYRRQQRLSQPPPEPKP